MKFYIRYGLTYNALVSAITKYGMQHHLFFVIFSYHSVSCVRFLLIELITEHAGIKVTQLSSIHR